MKIQQEEYLKDAILTIAVITVSVVGIVSCSAYMGENAKESQIAFAEDYMEDHAFDYVSENRYEEMVDFVNKKEGSYQDGYDTGYEVGYEDGYSDGSIEGE